MGNRNSGRRKAFGDFGGSAVQFNEGQKSKGILDDHAQRKSIIANEIIFDGTSGAGLMRTSSTGLVTGGHSTPEAGGGGSNWTSGAGWIEPVFQAEFISGAGLESKGVVSGAGIFTTENINIEGEKFIIFREANIQIHSENANELTIESVQTPNGTIHYQATSDHKFEDKDEKVIMDVHSANANVAIGSHEPAAGYVLDVSGAILASGQMFAQGILSGAGLTVDGKVSGAGANFTNDIVMADDQFIFTGTSDGADSESTGIAGGGSLSNLRGAFVRVSGNEDGNTGKLFLTAGNVTGGIIRMSTGGSTRLDIENGGNFHFRGNLSGATDVTFSGANITTGNDPGHTHSAFELSGQLSSGAITAVFISGGTLISGMYVDVEIPYKATINSATLLPDQSGTMEVFVYKDTFGNFPPNSADNISVSGMKLTAQTSFRDTTLKDWTTGLVPGDILRFNLSGAATSVTQATVVLGVTKS